MGLILKALLSSCVTPPLVVVSGSIAWTDENIVFNALKAVFKKHGSTTVAFPVRPAGASVMIWNWLSHNNHGAIRITGNSHETQNKTLASLPGVTGSVIFPGDDATRHLITLLNEQKTPIWYPKGPRQ